MVRRYTAIKTRVDKGVAPREPPLARSDPKPTVWVSEYKHVGAALAAARDRAGLTQAQLAKLPQTAIFRVQL